MTTALRRRLWIGALAFGIALIAVGGFFVSQALNAKAMIRAELASEQVTTSADAAIPGVPVTDARTAQAQADVIKKHALERYGSYASMSRDDPNRATYLDSFTLRTSLGLAVLGFGVSDLALGTGVAVLVIGLGTLVFGVPVLYWLRVPVAEHARHAAARQALATDMAD
jgi:hypothetical protein